MAGTARPASRPGATRSAGATSRSHQPGYDGQGGGHHRDHAHAGDRGGAAAARRGHPAAYRRDPGLRGVLEPVGVLVQGAAELLEPHRLVPSARRSVRLLPPLVLVLGKPSSAGSTRSLASALDVWLFTVPTEHSRTAAVCSFSEVLEEAEHDDGALPARQPPHRVPEVVPLGAAVVVARRGGLGDGLGGLLAVPLPAPPGRVGVHQDPADVRLRVGVDPVPGEPRLAQCGLEQVLGEAAVAGQQVRRAQQPGGPGRDEAVEVRPRCRGRMGHRGAPLGSEGGCARVGR